MASTRCTRLGKRILLLLGGSASTGGTTSATLTAATSLTTSTALAASASGTTSGSATAASTSGGQGALGLDVGLGDHLAGSEGGVLLSLLDLLGLAAGLGADDAVGDAETVDGVVGGGLVTEDTGDAEGGGVTVVGTVGVDVGDGDLDGSVVLGGDQLVAGVALAGDVEINHLSLLIVGTDAGHVLLSLEYSAKKEIKQL